MKRDNAVWNRLKWVFVTLYGMGNTMWNNDELLNESYGSIREQLRLGGGNGDVVTAANNERQHPYP